MRTRKYNRTITRLLLALLFTIAGVLHFLIPSFYLKIMPPYLPLHRPLIYVSGVCEILGGLGVLLSSTRRLAGFGLIALLVAVFPANVQMLCDDLQREGLTPYAWLLLLRLPVQPLLMWCVYWSTKG